MFSDMDDLRSDWEAETRNGGETRDVGYPERMGAVVETGACGLEVCQTLSKYVRTKRWILRDF